MRSLLSRREIRQLAFLEMLMYQGDLTLSQISESTGYSVRTLSGDIKQINEYIAPCAVETGSKGVSLYIPTDSSIREIYRLFMAQSRGYQLLLHLFKHEEDAFDDLADALFLSASTLKRTIQEVNQELKKLDIKITSSPYRVVGDEKNVTVLFITLLSESSTVNHYPLTDQEILVLKELCSRVLSAGGTNLSYPNLDNLLIWTYVRLVRVKFGHYSTFETDNLRHIMASECIDDELRQRFMKVFDTPLSDDIFLQMFHVILNFGFAWTNEELRDIAKRSPYHQLLYNNLKTMLQRIAAAFEISLDNTERLFMDLFNILQLDYGLVFALYRKSAIFTRSFHYNNKNNHTIIRRIIKDTLKGLINPEGIDEIMYLLVTHWPGLTKKIEASIADIKIGIFFDSDIEHAQMIADLLHQRLRVKAKVFGPVHANETQIEEICVGVDLLVTNIPGLDVNCEAVVCIREYPDSRDWRNILVAEENILAGKVL